MDADGWDERYRKGQVWTTEPNACFAETVRSLGVSPGRALDLACGEGRNAVWLAEKGWQVAAVDFSEAGIDRGRRWADEKGCEVAWVVADLQQWQPGRRALRPHRAHLRALAAC